MIKKIGTFALLIISLSTFAQTDPAQPAATQPTKRYSRPDIPGVFVLELGVNNSFEKKPSNFDMGFWGSRTLNVYYQYEMRLFHSKFSFVPGIGFSFERFKFKNLRVLGYNNDSLRVWKASQLGIPGIKKSQLITNYIEVPIEIKFSSRPEDSNRSIKASLGFRVGYMIDAFTKVKYREDGETKKFKNNQNYELNRLRYGVYFKFGVGNVSLFTYYNLTPLFKEGEGPYQQYTENQINYQSQAQFSTFTAGISFASF